MEHDHGEELELAAHIGLDWADEEHAVCMQAADSSVLETMVLRQEPEVLQAWMEQLRERFGGRKVGIALEQSRGPVIYALMSCDFLVLYPINPKALARYREAFKCSGAKDDPSDAALLLSFLKCHRAQLTARVPDDEQTQTIQLLAEHRRKTVNQRTKLVQALSQLLKAYFPQALGWAGELSSPQAWEFLQRWPSLEAVQKARPAQLRAFYVRHGGRRPEEIQSRLKQIREARPLTQGRAVITTSSTMVQCLAGQLQCLHPAVAEFDRQLKALFEQHPDHAVFESFPGAGAALAPRLLAAMGSRRERFASATQVQQYSGIAPVTVRSGKSHWVHRRWACPKFVLQSFHEFAKCSILGSVWARAYYDQHRERGVRHQAAVRALAFKWIRIIFRCWQEGTPYDEQRYIDALRRRGSPLIARLDKVA